MNIDEYREMMAQEKSQPEDTSNEVVEKVQEKVIEPIVEEVKTEEQKLIDNKLVIDGQEIDISEVKEWKRGYMRNEDYTHKTQDLARQRKEVQEAVALFDNIKANPELAQSVSEKTPIPHSLDPTTAKVQELENRLFDLMVEKEISNMQSKYSDFDAREALEMATSKGLNNLEDAYLLIQANKPKDTVENTLVDKDALEKELRAKIISEMNATREATSSIISTNDNAQASLKAESDVERLTSAELEFCRKSRTNPEDYAKWKKNKR